MDGIRQYIMSVICVVVLCGLVQMLYTGALVRLLCGLVVTITVLQPLSQGRIIQWGSMFEGLVANKEAAIWEGEMYANETLAELITQKTQAYILTKASELGASVTVEVQLQDDYPFLPEAATVAGAVSPYVKQQLIECLQQELGIAKEDQVWIS